MAAEAARNCDSLSWTLSRRGDPSNFRTPTPASADVATGALGTKRMRRPHRAGAPRLLDYDRECVTRESAAPANRATSVR